MERASTSSRWDPELRDHARSCPVCSTVVWTVEELRGVADRSRPDAVPDPHAMWWRAELLARHEAAARATLPVSLFERIGLPLVAATPVLLLALFWPALERAWSSVRLVLPQSELITTVLALALGTLVLVTTVGLIAAWVDE